MKKFLIKIVILFAALFIFDRITGAVFQRWISNIPTSYLGKDNYICDKCSEDILIFGSSRAEQHYNSKMMEDSLGIPVYNCGTSGFGIILSYGRILMISERYRPKYIIMEITPEFDYVDNGNTRRDLQHLKRHYERNGVKEIIDSMDYFEKYKMLSYLYRFNSDIIHNPLYLINQEPANKNAIGEQGYIAQNLEFDKMKAGKRIENEKFEIDPVKYHYFNLFLTKSNKMSKVVLVISPYFNGRNPRIFEPAIKIAKRLNIPLLDYSNNPKFIHHEEFFKDGGHLNANGADEFTQDLINDIKRLL